MVWALQFAHSSLQKDKEVVIATVKAGDAFQFSHI